MNHPYFSVGEEVILVSKMQPQYNGDQIVEYVIPPGEHPDPLNSNVIVEGPGYGYRLAGLSLHEDRGLYFDESALRKKYKPSDESFSELMTNYNTEPVQ